MNNFQKVSSISRKTRTDLGCAGRKFTGMDVQDCNSRLTSTCQSDLVRHREAVIAARCGLVWSTSVVAAGRNIHYNWHTPVFQHFFLTDDTFLNKIFPFFPFTLFKSLLVEGRYIAAPQPSVVFSMSLIFNEFLELFFIIYRVFISLVCLG